MTPACSLIIAKTRELLASTPDATLAKIYSETLNMGIATAPEHSTYAQKLIDLQTHIANLSVDQVAIEWKNSVEAIFSTCDEHIITAHCKYLAQAIVACSNTVS